MRIDIKEQRGCHHVKSQRPNPNSQISRSFAMRRLNAIAVCTGLLLAGIGGFQLAVHGQAAPAAQAPAAQPAGPPPPDTSALRQQYEQWRKDFKTWGKWAPIGQESKGTTALITSEKVQSAMKLVKNGIVVSLAHAEI